MLGKKVWEIFETSGLGKKKESSLGSVVVEKGMNLDFLSRFPSMEKVLGSEE